MLFRLCFTNKRKRRVCSEQTNERTLDMYCMKFTGNVAWNVLWNNVTLSLKVFYIAVNFKKQMQSFSFFGSVKLFPIVIKYHLILTRNIFLFLPNRLEKLTACCMNQIFNFSSDWIKNYARKKIHFSVVLSPSGWKKNFLIQERSFFGLQCNLYVPFFMFPFEMIKMS